MFFIQFFFRMFVQNIQIQEKGSLYPTEWKSSTATGRFFAFGATVFPEKAHLGLARRFVAVRYTIFSLRISFFGFWVSGISAHTQESDTFFDFVCVKMI